MNQEPVSLAELVEQLAGIDVYREDGACDVIEFAHAGEYVKRSSVLQFLAQHAVAEPQREFVCPSCGKTFSDIAHAPNGILCPDCPPAAHAAEQPKLTQENLRESYEWALQQDHRTHPSLFQTMADRLNNLLTSPVAPPTQVTTELQASEAGLPNVSGGPAIYSVNDPQHRTMAWQPGQQVEIWFHSSPEQGSNLAEISPFPPPVAPGERKCVYCGRVESKWPSVQCVLAGQKHVLERVAPGEQPPRSDAEILKRATEPPEELSFLALGPAPPAQERASDEALEDLPQIRYVATRGEPEPSGYYVPIKEAKKLLATAAKQAREGALELAVKAARDSLFRWKTSTVKWREYDAADIEADIRGTFAAQPSPRRERP